MSWAVSYWLPTEKWMPNYLPPYSWQIRDASYPMQLPTPPNGDYSVWPWWLNPDKSTWPYQPVPWAQKTFGAFSARKVTMWPEDLVNYPPFGNIKVKTPTDHPHSIGSIKVHMPPKPWLDITPHPSLWAEGKLEEALRQMSRKRPIKLQTEYGSITIKSMRHANWAQHRDDPRREAIEILRGSKNQEKYAIELATEIAANKSQPKPTRDLFS
jgi:hypothetical protein